MTTLNEESLKCGDCERPAPWVDGVLRLTDHAEDCAGIASGVVTVVRT